MNVTRIAFEWDQWNRQKNELKHGVSTLEAESCFFDEQLIVFEDIRHSTTKEMRYILYARSLEQRIVMIGFTRRRAKIRIITARPASRKEREMYEETKTR